MMKKNTGVAAFFSRLIYAGIFSSMILFCFPNLCGIADVNRTHIAVLLSSVLVFSTVRMLDRRRQIYSAAMGVLIFLFLASSANTSLINYEFLTDQSIYIESVKIFLLAVICYLVHALLEKNIFLRIVSADIVGGCLLYMRKTSKAGVVLFILYIGLVAAEWVRLHWKKQKSGNVQPFLLGILPFLLVYVILLCFMPMPDKPYEWQWIKKIYRSAEEKIRMYAENIWHAGGEYFTGATSGFSEDGEWFSDVTPDDRQLMTLGIGAQKELSVYLTGKVFDSFDGRKWENSEGIRGYERIMDVAETAYAVREYTGKANVTLYRSISMNVSYQYFHTLYLMAPSKTWAVAGNDKKISYRSDGDNLTFDRTAGYGTEYTVRFCQLNMEREELYRFLEWQQDEDVKIWEKAVEQYSAQYIPMEDLSAYRETINDRYLPKTDISPEVEQWLASVTAGARTDTEKLKNIEDALSGMKYNTSPGELPDTVTDAQSFMDYFILKKGEGYCVHYATAFVLLARAEGFPARYVQGFCIPVVSGDETFVYSNMAHAWPEVYIEGKGWIPFEPTPGFGVNRYLPESEDAQEEIEFSDTREPKTETQDDEPAQESEMPKEVVSEENENMPEGQMQNRWLPYLLRVVLLLLVGSVLAFAADRIWEMWRMRKRSIDEKFRLAILHNLQILSLLGYRREVSETFHELLERIRWEREDADGEEDDKKVENKIPCAFIEVYEKYLYGSLEVSEQILSDVLVERRELLGLLRRYRRRTYLICRLKLYIVRYR